MARAMIGSEVGVAARDAVNGTLLGAVATDTANGFTVAAASIKNFRPGQVIDIVTMTTGATGAGALGRTVVSVDVVTNTVVYSGADLTLTTAFGAYLSGEWELASPVANGNQLANDPYANLNGGPGVNAGFNGNGVFTSIDSMRARLTAISATTYSAAELDKMSYNDMVYAIRANDYPGSI
jgi:hypothetical protein